MASVFVSTPAEIVVIDSRTRSGTITLPVTNSIPYRVVSFKDQYGSFSNSTLTLSTQIGESFDDGTTTKTFHTSYGFATLYATSSKWMVMNASQTVQQTISSLFVSSLNGGTPLSGQNLVSTVTGLGSIGYISTTSLLSTTFGLQTSGFLSSQNLLSTVTGLGSAGYISTASLVSTTFGLQKSGFLSSPNLISTVTGLGSAGYISTASLVSTTFGLQTSGFLSSLNLVSTVEGLGTIGYLSSLNGISLLSTQQIFTSSIYYLNLAGPTTVVLYEY